MAQSRYEFFPALHTLSRLLPIAVYRLNLSTNKYTAVLTLFLSSTGWGLTWLPAKALLDMGLGSQHFIFFAFGGGALILLPFLWRQRAQWLPHSKYLFAIAIVGGFAYVSFQTAIARGDTVRVMILFYLLPIWSVLGGRFFLNESIDTRRILAMTLCIVGAALTLNLNPRTALFTLDWIDLLAMLSGVAFVGNNLLFRASEADSAKSEADSEKGKALSVKSGVSSVKSAAIPLGSKVAAMYLGCALQIALSLLLFPTLDTLPHNGAITLAIVYGAIWITLLTFATQWAVTQMEVSRSAIIIVMELVAAVISTALLTAHDLAFHEYIGGLLVLGAALLESIRSENAETVNVA
jgi:drug/metabolite transporter (DMT)-like permease